MRRQNGSLFTRHKHIQVVRCRRTYAPLWQSVNDCDCDRKRMLCLNEAGHEIGEHEHMACQSLVHIVVLMPLLSFVDRKQTEPGEPSSYDVLKKRSFPKAFRFHFDLYRFSVSLALLLSFRLRNNEYETQFSIHFFCALLRARRHMNIYKWKTLGNCVRSSHNLVRIFSRPCHVIVFSSIESSIGSEGRWGSGVNRIWVLHFFVYWPSVSTRTQYHK